MYFLKKPEKEWREEEGLDKKEPVEPEIVAESRKGKQLEKFNP
jgi:hypothetical protein